MSNYKLFDSATVGSIELKNRIVMAPMTRCRAIGNIPSELMATYYEQRSDAGLIITEGTSPSPNGLGYARIPGIYNQKQMDGWRKITAAVHKNGGKIFVQLMHTGRISHPDNMPESTMIIAPSAVKPAGKMWTDTNQWQDYIAPQEMSYECIKSTEEEYAKAAKNALAVGFDGVELHGANGYLLEQFLSPHSNIRTDNYGGSIKNRCRFVLEVVTDAALAVGKDKIGIRLSPYGVANDMSYYAELNDTYAYLTEQLNLLDIAYIHVVDHEDMGAPEVPIEMKQMIRKNFRNTLILGGGYDQARAEADIQSGLADLVAFGRPFISNPDLVERFLNHWPLSTKLNKDLFYTADEKGYTDYPTYESELENQPSL